MRSWLMNLRKLGLVGYWIIKIQHSGLEQRLARESSKPSLHMRLPLPNNRKMITMIRMTSMAPPP